MSDLKIFTENIEPEALNQIYTLVKQPAFADCKVRIMPDVHAGAGCVIGFTADLSEMERHPEWFDRKSTSSGFVIYWGLKLKEDV